MAMVKGWYKNSKGRRVYGLHSTSPGYYNKSGKWVNTAKKPHSHSQGSSGGSTTGGTTSGGSSTGGSSGGSTGGNSTNPNTGIPPVLRELIQDREYVKGGFKASTTRLQDGGMSANVNYKGRQLNFNLDNNEDLAQGSQTEWAMPSSISNLISGQLRQASNAPLDAWETWAANNGATVNVSTGSSPFNMTMEMTNNQPMGGFGMANVTDQYGLPPSDQQEQIAEGSFAGWTTIKDGVQVNMPGLLTNQAGSYGFMQLKDQRDEADWKRLDPTGYAATVKAAETAFSNTRGTQAEQSAAYNAELTKGYSTYFNSKTGTENPQNILAPNGIDWIANPNYTYPEGTVTGTPTGPGTTGDGYQNTPVLPMRDTTGMSSNQIDQHTYGTATNQLYNPWGRGQGAASNSYGPSQQTMANATMEAMGMANAYFAPQRAELAYELGDMETDMRRLSVNLGRQIDDPVLQAKLYKDGMRAVRTLDIQQNTLAFQLADARRREENQNFQFYDQLAQEENRMRVANRQFYDTYDLQGAQFNLQNWAAQNPNGVQTSGGTSQQQQGGYLATRKV